MKLDSVVFYTNSIDQIVTFYKETIGFTLEYQNGDRYVSFVFDNGARLGIEKSILEREIVGSQTAIIQIDNIEDLYESLKSKNVVFFEELKTASWGTTFSILDPDKNKVEFLRRS